MRVARRSIGIVVVVSAVAACGSRPVEMSATSGPAAHGAAPAAHAAQVADPVELRITYERLLGHHAVLAARFMRAQGEGEDDFVEAANAALVRNTDDLAAVVGGIYGEDAAGQFSELWVRHVELLGDYATTGRDGAAVGRTEAVEALEDYSREYADYVAAATGGAVPAEAAADNIRAHLDHLTGHFDAYIAGDYPGAFALQREAYAHMFPTGQVLATGLVNAHPGELPLDPPTASEQLRSTLGMLLGEHFELAVEAMRSGVTGSPDFSAVTGALDGNTRDLLAAVESVAGVDVAAGFSDAWADHIELLVEYTAAVAEDDDAERQAVMARMGEVRGRAGAAFSTMTGGAITAEAATQALVPHDEQLVAQVEAYAAGRFDEAHDRSYEAYQHMFDTAAILAPAIEAHLAPTLPVGPAQTGAGGAAPTP